MVDMAISTFMVIGLLIAAAVSAPQSSPNSDTTTSTIKSTVSMSYEELDYILRTKKGEVSVPPKLLSPCARAILGCCKDKVMNEHCSEMLKCGAFFFDDNPCDEQFV
ncbi:Uncharacterized protein OBRU01_23065, partial [Operophtera brumata]